LRLENKKKYGAPCITMGPMFGPSRLTQTPEWITLEVFGLYPSRRFSSSSHVVSRYMMTVIITVRRNTLFRAFHLQLRLCGGPWSSAINFWGPRNGVPVRTPYFNHWLIIVLHYVYVFFTFDYIDFILINAVIQLSGYLGQQCVLINLHCFFGTMW